MNADNRPRALYKIQKMPPVEQATMLETLFEEYYPGVLGDIITCFKINACNGRDACTISPEKEFSISAAHSRDLVRILQNNKYDVTVDKCRQWSDGKVYYTIIVRWAKLKWNSGSVED